jgi:hypothetical protein
VWAAPWFGPPLVPADVLLVRKKRRKKERRKRKEKKGKEKKMWKNFGEKNKRQFMKLIKIIL